MVETLALIFPLVLTNNLVMSAVKWLADGTAGKSALRVILGVASIIGIVAASAFTGNPVDFDSVSSIALATLQIVATGILSHFSYKVIKKA